MKERLSWIIWVGPMLSQVSLKVGREAEEKSESEWVNVRKTQLAITGFEGGRGYESRNVSSL